MMLRTRTPYRERSRCWRPSRAAGRHPRKEGLISQPSCWLSRRHPSPLGVRIASSNVADGGANVRGSAADERTGEGIPENSFEAHCNCIDKIERLGRRSGEARLAGEGRRPQSHTEPIYREARKPGPSRCRCARTPVYGFSDPPPYRPSAGRRRLRNPAVAG